MTESQPASHRKRGGLQTKALAGLVAIMLAAAIVALVFVTSGGGSKKDDQAGAGTPSDVGRTTSSAPTPTTTAPTTTAPSSTAPTSSAPTTPSKSAVRTSSVAAGGGKGSATGTSSPTTTATSSSHSSDSNEVVYTVKKGDTLYAIGKWYRDHGYLTLYNWNKSVIGKDPNLIFPGQKIIVVAGNVGVARKSH